MSFERLDTVVLKRDLPEHDLRAGDLGAIVEMYGAGQIEVEFVTASGRTKALVSLDVTDIRAIADTDLVAVRPLARPA